MKPTDEQEQEALERRWGKRTEAAKPIQCSAGLDDMELQPIKTDRLPLVDQIIDVARMLPSNCDLQIETLVLAKQILSCYATPVMIVRSSNEKGQR